MFQIIIITPHYLFHLCIGLTSTLSPTRTGSERVGRTDAEGARLKEAQHINKSLSALGDVIAALKTHAAHVPFRNSKLTFLLQDCLSGSSKSLMFCNVSPQDDDRSETLCSLKFAERVRACELGPTAKGGPSGMSRMRSIHCTRTHTQ